MHWTGVDVLESVAEVDVPSLTCIVDDMVEQCHYPWPRPEVRVVVMGVGGLRAVCHAPLVLLDLHDIVTRGGVIVHRVEGGVAGHTTTTERRDVPRRVLNGKNCDAQFDSVAECATTPVCWVVVIVEPLVELEATQGSDVEGAQWS